MNAKTYLKRAIDAQPCPACKEDMQKLALFLDGKLLRRDLDQINYINEATKIASFITNLTAPIINRLNITPPEVYKKVLSEDLPKNREVLANLKRFGELYYNSDKGTYKLISEINDSWIKVTEFKLSLHPKTFYLFDKIVRLGWKTKTLAVLASLIVYTKRVIA